jgi:hypothetical protein
LVFPLLGVADGAIETYTKTIWRSFKEVVELPFLGTPQKEKE